MTVIFLDLNSASDHLADLEMAVAEMGRFAMRVKSVKESKEACNSPDYGKVDVKQKIMEYVKKGSFNNTEKKLREGCVEVEESAEDWDRRETDTVLKYVWEAKKAEIAAENLTQIAKRLKERVHDFNKEKRKEIGI